MRPVLLHDKYEMNMRSIKNRLLLKGRKNKQTIITTLLALVAILYQGTMNKEIIEKIQFVGIG